MRLLIFCIYSAVAIFCGLGSNAGFANSYELAQSFKDVIKADRPEDWPAYCLEFRDQVEDDLPAPGPKRLEWFPTTPDKQKFDTFDWNGIRIPISMTDFEFDTLVLVSNILSAVGSDDASVMFTSLDLTAHFNEHFGGIEELSSYVQSGSKLVDWLETGLYLNDSDLKCSSESMISDMTHIVHSLMASITVFAGEDTWLIRISGDNPALVLGRMKEHDKPIQIQYIFQNPDHSVIELLQIHYHLELPLDITYLMSGLVSSVNQDSSLTENNSHPMAAIISAILDKDYDQASSLAKSNNLEVRSGLNTP